jgi:hypothetical protein
MSTTNKDILAEDIFSEKLDKRKQAKIEEMVIAFLRKQRKLNGSGYSVKRISEATGLDVAAVGFVLKSSLLYKKYVEWVEHKGIDYFRATSSA